MSADFLLDLFLQVWLPIALLVAAGGLWARLRQDPPADKLRICLNRLVVDVFAPPLLFALSAQAQIDRELLTVPVITIAGILASAALLYPLLYHAPMGRALTRESRAAILLAGSFGNVLFMGYPILTFLYGPMGGSYAAFADILASTPLLWTLGVWIATRLGHPGTRGGSLIVTVLRLPPIWGFVLGFAVNFAGLKLTPLIEAARFMGQATIPLMLFTLGLSIPWGALTPTRPVLLAVAVKLAIAPVFVLTLTQLLLGELRVAQRAAILEVAMPTMLMAASFADRFGLDVRAAALTVSWSSLVFMLSLPLWILLLG